MAFEIDIQRIEGLTEEEAAERLRSEGYNELPSARRRNILVLAAEVFREPMLVLLIAVGVIYLFLGDLGEALILMSFVVVVIGITLYQERKTEKALEALRDLSSPRALVVRNGEQIRIAGRDVVRGDILLLAEGDRVPADAVLLDCANLMIDESLLTGESVPVRKVKFEGEMEMERPGGDVRPFVYSGTLVVDGYGVAQVKATGRDTEMGKIGRSLEELKPEATRLQKETRKLVFRIASVGAVLCVAVIVVFGLTRHLWLAGVLAGLTLAMAILPEEFPVVLTVFLAMGAWRISKREVLTRRIPVVETLGSATVLCVDKTGTLTHNRISVSKIYAGGEYYDLGEHLRKPLPENFHEIVEFGILASHRDPFDPMEKAIKRLGDRKLFTTEHLHYDWNLMREYPLSDELMALSHVWKSPDGQEYVIAAKGAPEAVADLCHLGEEKIARLEGRVEEMADEGLRVIAVARSRFAQKDLPLDHHEFTFEFLGMIGLADPVRHNVAEALSECYEAGIRTIMITGDYPGTARNVAEQIGLEDSEMIITGPELDDIGDDELEGCIGSVNIFARVVPEQKLRIVKALQANGEVVAMTGDGVNDAPALKASQIGIAMGGRGTDVAREAAAMVLLDDDFSSIERAVRMGRRIFDNLKKAMSYILAIHVPIAGLSLIPVFLPGVFKSEGDLILLPVHVAFLELIIDPACSVIFEGEEEERNVMKRPPRDVSKPLFDGRTVLLSLLQGLSVLIIVGALLAVSLWRDQGIGEARALAFTTLVFANLGLIMVNRSWTRTIAHTLKTPNKALWWVIAGTLLFLGLVLYVPALNGVFGFSRLSAVDLAVCVGAGALSIAWFEALKLINGKRRTRV